ncbi:hypothetical protein [Bacillus sp. OK048]|uniref:hypothetical protein n=1 Tax=Bacillus sp. OK048 TaxID=1882761 RepID=UPI00087E6D3A|nr:hypothetical protein [Bacillus sp. OK048]SDM17623.1 hypothetical protein SAMN05443253_102176 [Bacillus sp. OK048]
MAEKRESNAGELKVKIDVDCSEALKGLKAVTRAAKKATAALKELEEQMNKSQRDITINVDGRKIVTEVIADLRGRPLRMGY